MKRATWEYRVMEIYGTNSARQATLCELGKQGWELVAVVALPDGTNWYHFKRQIGELL